MSLDTKYSQFPDNSHTILVIDDERQVLDNMEIYLSDNGYEVFTAANGTEALTVFNNIKPELVLCDLRMPDIDGLTLIETFTSSEPDIPIIVISGAGQIQDVTEALRLGAVDYLIKPITDFAVFDSAIESVLIQNHLKDEVLQELNKSYHQTVDAEDKLNLLINDEDVNRQAQLQLLPEPEFKINNCTFMHTLIPSGNYCEDFLDYFVIDSDYLGFYIADLTFHGKHSNFATLLLKSLINHPLRQYRMSDDKMIINPSELLAYLNHEFISSNIGQSLSIFYAVYNVQSNQFEYANGGFYPRPVLLSDEQFIEIKQQGLPIGLFKWADYEAFKIKLQLPFTFTMFSTGVMDRVEELSGNQFEISNPLNINHDIGVSELVEDFKLTSSNTGKDQSIFIIRNSEGVI